MSKRTPKLPMGASGYREANRQIKMKETLRVRAEKKKARKAAQPVAHELRPGRELARRILQLDKAHPAFEGSKAAMEVPGEMWAEWLRLAKMEGEKA